MDGIIEIIKYAWIPLLGIIWNANEKKNESMQAEIEKIKSKISHQMTKEDVNEVVNTATKLLTAEIRIDLQKIDMGVHAIKNQKSGEDGTLKLVLDQLKIMNDKTHEKQ